MSLKIRSRKLPFAKEHEIINKISKLLRVLTTASPRDSPAVVKDLAPIAKKKFSMRTKSLCPRVTLFDFASSKLVKPPVMSNQALPDLSHGAGTSLKKHYKVRKTREKTYMLPKKFIRSSMRSVEREEYDKYRRVLNLTEELINKENLIGWN